MSGLTVVDTDTLDAAGQVGDAVDFLFRMERQSTLAINAITQMELPVRCRNKVELRNTGPFVQRFQTLGLNEMMCSIAPNLLCLHRLSHGLRIPNAMIAATAMAMNQPPVSKNQRDYAFIRGLQLWPYPRTPP